MHVSLKVSKFLYRPILERLCHKFQVMSSTTSTNRYQSKSIVEFYLTFAFNGISFLWVWRMERSSVRSILESSLLSSSLSFNASRDNITLSEIAQRPSQLNLEKLAQSTRWPESFGIIFQIGSMKSSWINFSYKRNSNGLTDQTQCNGSILKIYLWLILDQLGINLEQNPCLILFIHGRLYSPMDWGHWKVFPSKSNFLGF